MQRTNIYQERKQKELKNRIGCRGGRLWKEATKIKGWIGTSNQVTWKTESMKKSATNRNP